MDVAYIDLGAFCCCDFCYPNWTQTISVWHQDQCIGKVLEVPVCCSQKNLEVWDKDGRKIYNITASCCPISCGPEVIFSVMSTDILSIKT